MNATTSALISTLVVPQFDSSNEQRAPPRSPNMNLWRHDAGVAIALAASTGCVALCHDNYGNKIAHVLGLDCGSDCSTPCGCGRCVSCGHSDCPPDCCADVDSSGAYCENEACLTGSAPGGPAPLPDPLHRICALPGETIGCVSSCCTPNACAGPPDCPPPGRFIPVPTRPAFSPRFAPGPYGPAEF